MRQLMPRVALAVMLATATTAEAQSGVDPTALTLEDLMATPVERVYGASKFQQKVSDAPAAVTIITAEEIRLHGYRSSTCCGPSKAFRCPTTGTTAISASAGCRGQAT